VEEELEEPELEELKELEELEELKELKEFKELEELEELEVVVAGALEEMEAEALGTCIWWGRAYTLLPSVVGRGR
jgi:hypothetical protein